MKKRTYTICCSCEAKFRYNGFKVERIPGAATISKGTCQLCGKKRSISSLVVWKEERQ